MQGHNWGSAHPLLYAWWHCNAFDMPDTFIEGVASNVTIGPFKSFAEWEDFVVEVLRTHGATVDRALGTGMDSTLIADYGPQRVAVFTLGEGQVVNSATVGHALAAKDRLRCDSCAIVINRRFTGAAQDFARRNGCTAIGAGEFPDFVLGKIEI